MKTYQILCLLSLSLGTYSTEIVVNHVEDLWESVQYCETMGLCNLRGAFIKVFNDGGGTIILNTSLSDVYPLHYSSIVLEPSNYINITLKGITEDEKPVINLNNNFIHILGNINIIFDNVVIENGQSSYYSYGYYYDPDDSGDDYNSYVMTTIENDGGGVYIKNGHLILRNTIIRDSQSVNGYGGGIVAIDSDLDIYNSEMTTNRAMGENEFDGGGGIYFEGENNTLVIHNSLFENNIGRRGGAIYIKKVNNSYIENSTFTGNIANSKGGSITIDKGYLYIKNCEFENNYGTQGGVIYISDGSSVYISENNIFIMNGAIEGGVIYNDHSNLQMRDSEMTENSASTSAGAIFNSGSMSLIGCVFNDNSASEYESDNILSVAEYYYNIIMMANVFEDGVEFAQGSLYASWKTCSSVRNDTQYACPTNTTCLNEKIGFRCVCSKGTYQNGLYKDVVCTECPLGTYCPYFATNEPLECPVGAYCDSISAHVCPVGHYCPTNNLTEPIDCNTDQDYRCPLASVYKMTPEQGNRYIEDILLSEQKYEYDRYAISYDDYSEYNADNWNTQVDIIMYSFIAMSLYWLCAGFSVKKYKCGISYIKKLKTIDMFSMNHYHKIGVPIKKKKTPLGGTITLFFIISIFFVSWFYISRYRFDNTEIVVTHITNATNNEVDYLDIGVSFDGVFSDNETLQVSLTNGIATSSSVYHDKFQHNKTFMSMMIQCNNCKFNDDEVIMLICSNRNDSYIRKIHWNVSMTSFRIGRTSSIRGVIVPPIPTEEVWKNNGTDLPILVLFLKPVKYRNGYYPYENSEGYSIEFQEIFVGTTRNKCNFFEDTKCTEEQRFAVRNIVNSGNSFKEGVCSDDKVGFKIIIKRTVGYYDVHVRSKYMIMDLLAEVFAMLGATFTSIAYLLVFIEMTKDKSQYVNRLKRCCASFCFCFFRSECQSKNDNNESEDENEDESEEIIEQQISYRESVV